MLENVLDPAHVPFAHHSMQGVRDDGRSILINVTSSPEDKHVFNLEYEYTAGGRPLQGSTRFTAPCYFALSSGPLGAKALRMWLLVLVVPVEPGKVRAFSLRPLNSRKHPQWWQHILQNKFFDSDLWIHDQERFVSGIGINSFEEPKPQRYVMPTASDNGVRGWRAWWTRHMSHSPAFALDSSSKLPWLSLSEQRDRYENHIKTCRHCTSALQAARRVQRWAPVAAALGIVFGKSWPPRLLGALLSAALHLAADWVVRTVGGPDREARISAAQFDI